MYNLAEYRTKKEIYQEAAGTKPFSQTNGKGYFTAFPFVSLFFFYYCIFVPAVIYISRLIFQRLNIETPGIAFWQSGRLFVYR